MKTLIIGLMLLSSTCFANTLSILSKVAMDSKVKALSKVGTKHGFEVASITSSKDLTGHANKGICQIYVVKFRNFKAISLQEGDTFEQRQQSIEKYDNNVEVCATAFEDFFSLQLMQFEYAGKVDDRSANDEFETLAIAIEKKTAELH